MCAIHYFAKWVVSNMPNCYISSSSSTLTSVLAWTLSTITLPRPLPTVPGLAVPAAPAKVFRLAGILLLDIFADLTHPSFSKSTYVQVKFNHLFYSWCELHSTARISPLDSSNVGLLKDSPDFWASNSQALFFRT